MEETRESSIAAILARGLFRVRRRHGRVGLTGDPPSAIPEAASNDSQHCREPEPPLARAAAQGGEP